jgi:hypothetical protein
MAGIRASLAVDRPQGCPVARASSQSPEPVREVRWAQSDDGTAEQFETAGAVEKLRSTRCSTTATGGLRVRCNGQSPCFCEALESHVGPVTEVVARDGALRVTVHADDVDALRDVLRELT